jgi:hypothetical protein
MVGDVRVSSSFRREGICFVGSGLGMGLNIRSNVLYHEYEGSSISGNLFCKLNTSKGIVELS